MVNQKIMKKIIVVMFSLVLVKNGLAQTTSNIPYQALLNVNPSFAGTNGGVRNQAFAELPSKGGYRMYNFSNAFDCYLPSLKSGIGLLYNYQSMGDVLRIQNATLIYSRHFKVGEKLKIVPSLQGGVLRREINYTWMYSPQRGWQSEQNYAIGYGVLVNYKNFYAGFNSSSIDYLPATGANSSRFFYFKHSFHASYNLNLTENFHVNFSGQLSSEPARSNALISANFLVYKHFIMGATRASDVVGYNAGVRTDLFTAQVSYKSYISSLMPDNTLDYWQLMLSFNMRNKDLRHAVTNFEAW
ncbi:hypothetical protein CNR22_09440 [Sphingobacteriaceae bacterium]|nr:hypothetical protein CNR22_09440 [Sphingobacteriaceae bacterium]